MGIPGREFETTTRGMGFPWALVPMTSSLILSSCLSESASRNLHTSPVVEVLVYPELSGTVRRVWTSRPGARKSQEDTARTILFIATHSKPKGRKIQGKKSEVLEFAG